MQNAEVSPSSASMPPIHPPGPGPGRPASAALPRLRRPDGLDWLALLADDNPMNREVGTGMLQALGLQVHTAHDGHAVLAMARTTRYDLVLMDLQMPVLDGFAATRGLRALPGMEVLPVIAVTANNSDDIRRACFEAGMNAFVTKPIDLRLLAAAVQACLPGA
jgi:two-component system, sensor histidine kinase and response regulator